MTARKPAHPRTPTRGRQPTARGRPHLPQEDPDAPGCCRICHRPMTAASDRHVDQLPPTSPDVTAEERRRYAEGDE